MSEAQGDTGGWRPGERELREREVASQRVGVMLHIAATLLALLASVTAVVVALQAVRAVAVAEEGIRRQTEKQRLSTVLESIGGESSAERAAGYALLRRHVEGLAIAATSAGGTQQDRDEVLDLYAAAVDIFENYLHNPVVTVASATPQPSASPVPAGRGYGSPRVPVDVVYVLNELEQLLKPEGPAGALARQDGQAPSIDLANTQLYKQSMQGLDVSWLRGKFLVGIDLRGTNLRNSIWGEASLERAYLQCANLEGADFRGTRLQNADLRGANVAGADFIGAVLDGAKFEGVAGLQEAVGLAAASGYTPPEPSTLASAFSQADCLANQSYWASAA